jgi:cell division protein FtsI (penicillin-binding protein 3)
MSKEKIENQLIRNRSVILLSGFIFISLLFLGIFLFTIGLTVTSSRHTDNKFISVENKAVRGKIISADNFVLAYSQKLFRAEINTKSIDPKKRDLFVKLFSIYSGMSEKEVLTKFVDKSGKTIQGRIVLNENIDVRLASDLR